MHSVHLTKSSANMKIMCGRFVAVLAVDDDDEVVVTAAVNKSIRTKTLTSNDKDCIVSVGGLQASALIHLF